MSENINVDYDELNNLSLRTKKNKNDFEECRKRFISIIGSFRECWEGDEADYFIDQAEVFFKTLGQETLDLEEWDDFFGKASIMYGNTEEENTRKLEQAGYELEDSVGGRA
jgi:uncharacterized protein YukE